MFSRIMAPGRLTTRAAVYGRILSFVAITSAVGACGHSRDAVDVATQPAAVIATDGVMPTGEPEAIARDARVVPARGMLAAGDVSALGASKVRHLAPHAHADTDAPYMLDSGDRIRIFVYGQPNLSRLYVVDHDGNIAVPLIGEISARGKTTSELHSVIRSRLGAEFVKDPQVTVDIQQNRPFFILGEVRTAGQYPYVSGMTVETAVAIAGGFTERASDRKYRITRRINGFVEQIEAPGDYVVKPGDTVYVFERFF